MHYRDLVEPLKPKENWGQTPPTRALVRLECRERSVLCPERVPFPHSSAPRQCGPVSGLWLRWEV